MEYFEDRNIKLLNRTIFKLKQERAELITQAQSDLINHRFDKLAEVAKELEQITESIEISQQDIGREIRRLNESMIDQINAKLYGLYNKTEKGLEK